MSLSEFPVAQQPNSGGTPRAEEMVLSVPDGRSVRTLVKATRIPAEGTLGHTEPDGGSAQLNGEAAAARDLSGPQAATGRNPRYS